VLLLVGGVADPKGAVGSGGDGAQACSMQTVVAELAAAVGDLQHARAAICGLKCARGPPSPSLFRDTDASDQVEKHVPRAFHLQLLISRPMHAGLCIFTE
jgi:hypothetical protein